MRCDRDRILVTVGDPNGIGPEIAIKAALELAEDEALRPVIVADRHLVEPIAHAFGADVNEDRKRWGSGASPSVDLEPLEAIASDAVTVGRPSAASGEATITYVKRALELMEDGIGRAIVACPHSETAVNASGRDFSGYPRLLAELLDAEPDSVFALLIGGGLRISHVTLHEGLMSALTRMNAEMIERCIVATHDALERIGISQPRIGVFGFNPHAGEGGLFGAEDDTIVGPAVHSARARGIDVVGPEGADVMLVRNACDAYVAMYHDQGHIPVKLKAGQAIAGLSIGGGCLFSSVGHGTAFDIAGQNRARCDGLVSAIRLLGGVK
ncbi:PdxA family dehydrogenase [Martelella sp. AMO21009]